VRDIPLKELKRETDVLAQSIERCDEKFQDVSTSLARLKKLKALLKADLEDKSKALSLDRKCLDMVATDGTQALARLPDSATTGLPFGWKKDTHMTLDQSLEAHGFAQKVGGWLNFCHSPVPSRRYLLMIAILPVQRD
jgi:hypothetical protein